MEEPMCTRCKTDKYLRFTHVVQPTTRQRSFRAQGGVTINKPQDMPGEVDYFCHACGLERAHSVPSGWAGSVLAPDLEELKQRGDFWPNRREHAVRQADGSWMTKVGQRP